MTESLTPRQETILHYIRSQLQARGYPPSVREICKAVGLRSSSTVHGHLAQLEKKGFIRRDPTKPRAIEMLKTWENAADMLPVPIVGQVTAGEPILAVENLEGTLTLPREFTGGGDVFLLRVRGDSMIEAGILDGDMVLVRRQDTATNGDIVVALLEDEATVKRFYREQDHLRLQPENSRLEPILVRDARILGRVVGVLRRL